MKRTLLIMVAILAAAALPAVAGEWHSGATNLCTDCHTMHFSQTHNWDGSTPVPTTAQPNGNWLGSSGPNAYLLKAPGNTLCLSCHNGQTFAPDVLEANFNASPTQGRSAGALNELTSATPYDTYKGHTLDSTTPPPGYTGTFYTAGNGLECISCHAQHGPVTAYRNIGPYSMPDAGAGKVRPTYVINTTNDITKDVWVNIAGPYVANSGNAAIFNPFYDNANISYNRNDATVTINSVSGKTSNRMDSFCAECHGTFHGGLADSNIGGSSGNFGFLRHPTSQVVIGASTQGGHSSLARFVAATTKVKVYANDRTAWTDAAPGCVSCHKGHGNQNPFGLIFLSRDAASVGEQGGYKGTDPPEPANGYQVGYRNLCGQCHGQGS